jgi:hypothetical protein
MQSTRTVTGKTSVKPKPSGRNGRTHERADILSDE